MDGYFELFEKILKNERSNEGINKELLLIEETVKNEVEFLRQSVGKYQIYIKELVKSDEFGLTENYIKLKETSKILQHKNEELQNRIEKIDKNSTNEKDDIIKQYDKQLEIHKNEYKTKIHNLEQRNQELLTELHMIQATAAVELDETEKYLKQQLNETNQRLRDELNSSQTLRNDLRLLKDEYEQHKNWSNKKIMDLKRQLEYTQEQNKLIQLKNSLQNQVADTAINTDNLDQNNQQINKTNTKDSSSNNNDDNSRVVKPQSQFKRPAPIYRGPRRSSKTPATPPLQPCSAAGAKKPGRNKRKLFNPNDFTHLETP